MCKLAVEQAKQAIEEIKKAPCADKKTPARLSELGQASELEAINSRFPDDDETGDRQGTGARHRHVLIPGRYDRGKARTSPGLHSPHTPSPPLSPKYATSVLVLVLEEV